MATSHLTRLCLEWSVLRAERIYRNALYDVADAAHDAKAQAKATARINQIDAEIRDIAQQIGALTPANASEAMDVLHEFRGQIRHDAVEADGLAVDGAYFNWLSRTLDGVAEWVRLSAVAA